MPKVSRRHPAMLALLLLVGLLLTGTAYAAIAPSGSTEASPVNETVSAVVGAAGEKANAAVGRPSTLIATVAGAPVSGPEATV